jgi:predicted secreted protein
MAKHVLRNAGLKIGTTDLSDHTSSLQLEDSADEVEVSAFGAGYREFLAGLKTAQITATMFNDYAAASVDAVIAPLYEKNESFTVKAVADKAASIGATNPLFTMTGQMYSYSPIAGAVGDANTTDITINNAGTTGLTRATTGTF